MAKAVAMRTAPPIDSSSALASATTSATRTALTIGRSAVSWRSKRAVATPAPGATLAISV
jgi:hypothetical protein